MTFALRQVEIIDHREEGPDCIAATKGAYQIIILTNHPIRLFILAEPYDCVVSCVDYRFHFTRYVSRHLFERRCGNWKTNA